MILYSLRRLGTGLVLAVLVTLITFLIISASFGAVVHSLLGQGDTPKAVAALTEQMGFNRPVIVQYGEWLWNAVRGDFGISYFTSEPVAAAIPPHLGVTLSLVVVSLLITVAISWTLGIVAAYRGGIVDRITQIVSLIGYIVPGLLLAIGLVVIFAVNLKWLPATGYTPLSQNPVAWAASITIPVIALVFGGVANMAAQVRGAMIDELRKDYVRTLRTRGIPVRSIVLRHALRNAASPALTVLSLTFIEMFGGALIIEKVFALPGFGIYSFNAALQADIPVIMGVAVFGVLLVIAVNLAVDLVNGWLNPKARIY